MRETAALLGPVADLLRETAARELVPRFRNLSAGDIREKAPNDLVTAADLAMEAALIPAWKRCYRARPPWGKRRLPPIPPCATGCTATIGYG
ncbi:hypothetical protein [Elstera litoralis]|uniref:hypothetical protein n=1 Tax=Elstera litoralis TaxID=552518 RepID=UPI001E5623FE|nr:hypothetical protein [Elstera litoralis]